MHPYSSIDTTAAWKNCVLFYWSGLTDSLSIAVHAFASQDYLLRMSIDTMNKKNGFKLAKERNRRYPAQTITDGDYTDDIALLANTPAQVETLPHSLERAAGGIGLHVNVDKTEDTSFN